MSRAPVPSNKPDMHAYFTHQFPEGKNHRGKRLDIKCQHCHNSGHTIDRCWNLHPELKPKFMKDHRGKLNNSHKANLANHSSETFGSSPVALLNDFANYLQIKQGQGATNNEAIISQFAGFLAETNSENSQGILLAFMTALEISSSHDLWVIDSGATDHMSNKLTNFDDFCVSPTPVYVSVANGKGAAVKGKGKMKLVSSTIESDVLYIPSFPFQLLSVKRITTVLNCEVVFSSYRVIFQDLVTKKMIGEGFLLHGLYYFSPDPELSKSFQAISAIAAPVNEHLLWHRRLAHPSNSVFNSLFPSLSKGSLDCEICHFAKSCRLPFKTSLSQTSHIFEMIHSDVWGPFSASIDGFRYFVTFIDDFSRVTWIYLLKTKCEVLECFENFHALVTTQFSAKIKILRSDNGSEYMSHNMTNYLNSNGIMHQTSCVYTPQQNGLAERKNRDLMEKTCAIMLQMNVPKYLWSYGVLTATHLINLLPSRVLDFKCPLEVLQVKAQDMSHLKVFGCTCYVHLPQIQRDKLDPRAVKCIFLGYSQTKKGYKCYEPKSKKLYVSRDVKFAETIPYFEKNSQDDKLQELFPLPSTEPVDHLTEPVDRLEDRTEPVDRLEDRTEPVDRLTEPVDRLEDKTEPVDRLDPIFKAVPHIIPA